jgi:ribosomal-protein-alanine N-acetyltransferase
MLQIPTLQTERLALRAPRESDTQAYQDFYSDGEASKFYGGPLAADAAWLKLARDVGHWHLRGYGPWVLERKNDKKVVGGCGLFLHNGWSKPELTWWIASHARRMGFATEASKAAIHFGYETLKWELVQTYMKDENVAAKSLVKSLGGLFLVRQTFPDGIARDVYELPRQ